MKRLTAFCVAGVLLFAAFFSITSAKSGKNEINALALKGPTAIGMARLMDLNEQNKSANKYNFEILGTADEVVAKLTKGEADIAAVPANLAAVLYNKTKGQITVCAVNTLGVLYILDATDEIETVEDLKGRTIYSVGKGTTPEFALNYVLEKNGLTPGKDVVIEYKAEATELAALLSAGQADIVMLPEPYVTTILTQNENVKIALSLTDEWDKIQEDFSLITGTLVATRSFAGNHKKELDSFLREYEKSIMYVSDEPEAAAELVVKYGIVPKYEIAINAIPRCNTVYIEGEQMERFVSGYLGVLYEADVKSVGGKLPDEKFYYKK